MPETITRPNGKPYRPRKVTAEAIVDDDGVECGVVVLGTHDTARAQALANEYVARHVDSRDVAACPEPGWYRLGVDSGTFCWVTDEEHGRAGVWFREIVEPL